MTGLHWPIKYKDRNILGKCEECDEEFFKKQETHRYCSPKCLNAKWKRSYKSVVPEGEQYSDAAKKKWELGKQLICPHCKKSFEKKHVTQKYCNKICRSEFSFNAQRLKAEQKREEDKKYVG